MKKVLITLSAFAVALMITLSSQAACPCSQPAMDCCPQKQCCPQPRCTNPCNTCNTKVINESKACKRNSWEVIKYSQKLSKFERIVKKAGMEKTIECGGYLVFAPTNCALKGMKFNNCECAKKFVMNHLADCKCYPEELCAYSTIKTLCGKEEPVCKEGNMMRVGKATVVVDNVRTQNGRVYALDRKL